MIDQTQVQAFQKGLSDAHQQLYAVLDGASMPNLLALFARQRVTHVCLLPGELDPELAQTAPYLARLEHGSAFAELILARGLGQHWGILAATDANFLTLRMHFRKLVSVWDPDGKPLFFRYYDPRVLRVYLPTCNAEELAELFGPICAYYAEGETADTLIRFTSAANGLGQQTLSLARSGSPA
jgi:hypothetical protein